MTVGVGVVMVMTGGVEVEVEVGALVLAAVPDKLLCAFRDDSGVGGAAPLLQAVY